MDPKKSTAAVQGFGNVGSITAKYMEEAGIKIVAIGDHTGAFYNAEGINIADAIAYRTLNNGVLKGFPGGKLIPNEELLT